MKKTLSRSIYFLIIFLLGTQSCKKQFGDLAPLTTIVNTDPNFVSMSAAATAARQINNSRMVKGIISKQAKTGRPANNASARTLIQLHTTAITLRQIADSLALPDNANPSYYIFNYVGGGYVILAADKRVQPVLSFSNTNSFKYSTNMHPELLNWLKVNDKNMKIVQKHPELKAPKGVTALWAEITGPAVKGTTLSLAPPPPTCVVGDSIVGMVGPLLQTRWGQGYPYNWLCPYNTSAYNYTGNYYDPTGCVATAMAQIMYYWQYPTSYNWAAMPLIKTSYTTTGGNAVSQLMSDIGGSVSMAYTPSESTAPAINAPYCLLHGFGYSTDISFESNYDSSNASDYSKILNNLDIGWPVLLSGDDGTTGHEWVCDGFEEIESTFDCDPLSAADYLLFDMNWGGDGYGDGWYTYNYWNFYNGYSVNLFRYNLTLAYNIHP